MLAILKTLQWSILTWTRGLNHDHEGGSSRARLLHCTKEWLTPAISPNVGNSTSSFLLVGICVRANPFDLTERHRNWAVQYLILWPSWKTRTLIPCLIRESRVHKTWYRWRWHPIFPPVVVRSETSRMEFVQQQLAGPFQLRGTKTKMKKSLQSLLSLFLRKPHGNPSKQAVLVALESSPLLRGPTSRSYFTGSFL